MQMQRDLGLYRGLWQILHFSLVIFLREPELLYLRCCHGFEVVFLKGENGNRIVEGGMVLFKKERLNGMNFDRETQVQEVTRKIVNTFHPEKVILFGSWAWGQPGPDSDIDLLIIKESDKPRVERERELSGLLFPRRVPLDLFVYTPSELNKKIEEDGNLFLEDIVRNGIVLYADNKIRC